MTRQSPSRRQRAANRRAGYWTTKVACARALPQVTSIGHVPSVVAAPIFQVQLTAPAASDVFGTRPCAELGPLLYVTTMLQEMFGAVETAAKPVPLRETGDRTEVKATPTGFTVGAAVAAATVAGACVAGAGVTARIAGVAGDAVVEPGAAVTRAVTSGVSAGVAVACVSGTMPASRVAGVPHPTNANRTTHMSTENRFSKSRPSPI